MKILFITDNFPPEINAPANRTHEHCKEWVKLGAEVTVITCFPNFPKGKVFESYKNSWRKEEDLDGIRVIRVWSYITENSGFIKRILDYISFGITSFLHGLFIKADVVIGTSPQFFSAMSAWQISLFTGRKWVMEVRDLWPESIIAVGAMKNKNLIKFLEWVELLMYKSADKIIVVTDTFKAKISDRNIYSDKIKVFKNGVDLSKFYPASKPIELSKKLGLEEKFIVAYIGTHGLAHGLDFILDQAFEIKDEYPCIHFLLLGDGANKANLEKRAQDEEIKNVTFLPSVSKKEVLQYLHLMDVALVNLKKSDTFKTVIPSKIFEAAAVEKPILLGLEGETKQIVESYHAGVCYEPENGEAFKEALFHLFERRNNLDVFRQGCKKLAYDFERNRIAIGMLEEIKSMV